MSIDTIIRTINLILAPVVMVTSCAIVLNGLFGHYENIAARLRAMHRERLELLQTVGQLMNVVRHWHHHPPHHWGR